MWCDEVPDIFPHLFQRKKLLKNVIVTFLLSVQFNSKFHHSIFSYFSTNKWNLGKITHVNYKTKDPVKSDSLALIDHPLTIKYITHRMHAICSWHFVHSFIRGHSAGIRPPAGHVFIIFSYITHENDYKIVCSWMLTWLWFSKTTKLYKEPKKTPENHKNKHSNCDPRLLRVVGILIFPLPPTQRALITGSEIALALRLRCRRD